RLGGFLELAQDERRDLRRRVLLAVDIDLYKIVRPAGNLVGDEFFFGLDLIVTATHEALDRVDRASGVGDRLSLRRVANQALAFVGEGHDAGGQTIPVLIGNDFD